MNGKLNISNSFTFLQLSVLPTNAFLTNSVVKLVTVRATESR